MNALSSALRQQAQPYRVDISRGTVVSRVSSEWFNRPQDERYLSLNDLYASVRSRAERATTSLPHSFRGSPFSRI